MSIESVVDADYSSVITTMRGHLAKGTSPSASEQRLVIAVVQDACSRGTSVNAVLEAVVADIEVLDATACAANAGADAAAVIATAVTDLEAAVVDAPTYTVSVGEDG